VRTTTTRTWRGKLSWKCRARKLSGLDHGVGHLALVSPQKN
jgi:hypothetical protein